MTEGSLRHRDREASSSRFGLLRGSLAAGWQHGLALVFPPRCACCDADLADLRVVALCDSCRQQLVPVDWAPCPRCGAIGEHRAATGGSCSACSTREPKFDGVVALGVYERLLRDAILRMKRPAGVPLARVMGRLFLAARGDELRRMAPDVVVAVAMFWSRQLLRGINSPVILANALAAELGVPVRRCLVRSRNTLPQANLTPQQRLKNVRGAFRASRRARLEGLRVLLVDDILTTGATCDEAARALKQAGAAAVFPAVLGRARRGDTA